MAGLDECRDENGKLDLAKVDAFEAALVADQETHADTLVLTRMGLLDCQVCALKELTPEEVGEWTNRLNPAGTSNGWRVDDGVPPVACASDPDRLHWILVC